MSVIDGCTGDHRGDEFDFEFEFEFDVAIIVAANWQLPYYLFIACC